MAIFNNSIQHGLRAATQWKVGFIQLLVAVTVAVTWAIQYVETYL